MAKILVVEDDPNVAHFVSTILLGAGHPCLCAASAAQAHDHLKSEPDIALAIVDYHLGDQADTGTALLNTLRRVPRFEALPVIVCTADARHEVVHEFLPLRIAGFVRKPFRPERLLADIARVLDARD